MRFAPRLTAGLLSCFTAHIALADGSSAGQIYAPYVQPLEKEIELVGVYDERSSRSLIPSSHWTKVGYGTALWDHLYTEVAVTRTVAENETYTTVELEGIWQITEQGEYDSDWGMLFELETSFDRSAHEFTVGLLNSRDWGRWTFLTNVTAAVEWGDDIHDEIETALAIQTRYRASQAIEPTLEIFMAQYTLSMGPGLTGIVKFDGPEQLRWNAVVLTGLDNNTDLSVKLEFEYEFF